MKLQRPELLNPIATTNFNELQLVADEAGTLRGSGIVYYVWTKEVLVDLLFVDVLAKLQLEVNLLLAGTAHPGARGVVFYFEVPGEGTPTYVDVFINLENTESRQVIRNIKSKKAYVAPRTDLSTLNTSLLWMEEYLYPEGQLDVLSIGIATYARNLE